MTTDRRITIEERREAARKRKARYERRRRLFRWIGSGLGCLVVLANIALIAVVIWVVIHFVMKAW